MSAVETRIAEGVAWLTLNRPEAGNAIDMALAEALFAALSAASEDEAVRVIVLGAAGKLFCGGGDIAAFGTEPDEMRDRVGAIAQELHRSMVLIDEMEKPLVTSVQGTAAGAGLVLAVSGDIVLAAERAKFVPAYAAMNLTPDGGSSWLLPRLMGERRAMELLLTGQTLTAHEAAEAGLVSRVVAGETLEEETTRVAAALAGSDPWAMAQTRRLVRAGRSASLRAHLEDEAEHIGLAAARPAGRATIKKFLSGS